MAKLVEAFAIVGFDAYYRSTSSPVLYDVFPHQYSETSVVLKELPLFCSPYGAREIDFHAFNRKIYKHSNNAYSMKSDSSASGASVSFAGSTATNGSRAESMPTSASSGANAPQTGTIIDVDDIESLGEPDPRQAYFFSFVMTDEKKSEYFISCLNFYVLVDTVRPKLASPMLSVASMQNLHLSEYYLYRSSSFSSSGGYLSPRGSLRRHGSSSNMLSPSFYMSGNHGFASSGISKTKSFMIGAMEFVCKGPAKASEPGVDSTLGPAVVNRDAGVVSSSPPASPSSFVIYRRSMRVRRDQFERYIREKTVYERVKVYRPLTFVLISKLPIFETCRSLLASMYHNYISSGLSLVGLNARSLLLQPKVDGIVLDYNNYQSPDAKKNTSGNSSPTPVAKVEYDSYKSDSPNEFFNGLYEYLTRACQEEAQGQQAESGSTSPSSAAYKRSLVRLMPKLFHNLVNLMFFVPLPPPGRISVEFYFFGKPFRLRLPDIDDLPLCDVPLSVLFDCLSERNVVSLMNHCITDSKIVLVSESLALLGYCSEALRRLLYPFSWPHVVITILPSSLIDMLDAPVPYLIGVHASLRSDVEEKVQRTIRVSEDDYPPVIVDLDRNIVSQEASAPFPSEEVGILIDYLRRILRPMHSMYDYLDRDSTRSSVARPLDRSVLDRRIRELVVQFFCTIVGSVDEFISEDEPASGSPLSHSSSGDNIDDQFAELDGPSSRLYLNEPGYLSSRPEYYQSFLKHFLRTTIFEEFKYNKNVFLYKELSAMDSLREMRELLHAKLSAANSEDGVVYRVQGCESIPDVQNDISYAMSPLRDRSLSMMAAHVPRVSALDSEYLIADKGAEYVEATLTLLMMSAQRPDLSCRLYLMRSLVFEASSKNLKALQDLSCVLENDPRLVQEDNVVRNMLKLKELEIDFVLGMPAAIKGVFAKINAPKFLSVKRVLYKRQRRRQSVAVSEFEVLLHAYNAVSAAANTEITSPRASRGNEHLRHVATFDQETINSMFQSFTPSKRTTLTSAYFYVISYESSFITRSHTATVVYDALRGRDPELSLSLAKTFFEKLGEQWEYNCRVAKKLPLHYGEFVAAYSTLCSNSNGVLGRLFLTQDSLYFGLASQYNKIAAYKDIARIEKDESDGLNSYLIVLVTTTGDEHEFRMLHDCEKFLVYISELQLAHYAHNFVQMTPDEQKSRIREVGFMVLLLHVLTTLNKSPTRSIFDNKQNYKRSHT